MLGSFNKSMPEWSLAPQQKPSPQEQERERTNDNNNKSEN